jgi:hypothetical protein
VAVPRKRIMPPRTITPTKLNKLRSAKQANGTATTSDKSRLMADPSGSQGAQLRPARLGESPQSIPLLAAPRDMLA